MSVVRLSTEFNEEAEWDEVHIFMEGTVEDRLMPEALCGEVAMGHFHLERASEAVQALPVPTSIGREGLEETLAYLLDEEILCGQCLWEYRDETGNLTEEFDWSGVDP